MKAVRFKECNIDIAKDQDQYHTLPALVFDDKEKTMVTCYKLTFWERIRVLFKGNIWMSEMTFGRNITPRRLSTQSNDHFTKNPKNK